MAVRWFAALLLSAGICCAPAWAQDHRQSFAAFVASLWPEAQTKGITRATFDLAMRGVIPDRRVIAATQRQPEYAKPVGAYIDALVTRSRILRGAGQAQRWAKTLAKIETTYRVERWIVVALWGLETDYGAVSGHWDVFRSLATLAYIRYRPPYFRDELIAAMRIMQDGHIARGDMVSSWAGALGQTQFMPSSFIDYAVDVSGDRKPDIWTNVPDVLGSIANYLHKSHWQYGLPWGFEVVVPKRFDTMRSRASFAEWRKLGFIRADGKPFPDDGPGILFFPSGIEGPAFIVTSNFEVLKKYNNSDAYALAVGHLADRMKSADSIKAKWPNDVPLPRAARIALQKKLSKLGYKVNDFEGHIDFDLRDNIRAEQAKHGLVPDGDPTPLLLERLGVRAR